MKRLTEREMVLVCTAVTLVIAFVSYYTLILPGNTSYAGAKSRLETARSERVGIEAGIDGIESQKSVYEHKEKLFLEGQQVFDQVTDSSRAELKVLDYLENNHIKPEKTSVSSIEERQIMGNNGDSAYIYVVAVTVRASGNWDNFGSLMGQAAKDPRIRILAFTAKEDEKGSFDKGGTLSLNMNIEYYMLNSRKKPGSDVRKGSGS